MKLLIVSQYTYYLENSIIVKIFQNLIPDIKIKYIENKGHYKTFFSWILNFISFLKSDIIILGPFMPAFSSKLLKLIKLVRKNKPIIVYHTKELPLTIHQYKPWEESDYFISNSYLTSENHCYLPSWWEFFSFGEGYDKGRKNHKLGKFVTFADVNKRKNSFEDWKKRENKAIFISTHLSHPKDYYFKEINKFIKCEGYGKAFDKSIKHYYNSGFTKLDKLLDARYDFSVFNAAFTGYVDERIFDAYSCGCIPIVSNNYPEFMNFINKDAIIFFNSTSTENFNKLFQDEEKLKKIYESPLIKEKPNLDNLITFIKKIIDKKVNQ